MDTTQEQQTKSVVTEAAVVVVPRGGRIEVPSIQDLMGDAIQTMLRLIEAGHALSCALSGGKDSTCVATLMLEAVRQAKARGIVQPMHFVTSSSTQVENPAVEGNLRTMHDEIRAFVEREGLPVEVHMVEPSLASSFVVSTIGRGTLPRFPENGKARQCSANWKVQPQQRLVRELSERTQADGFREVVSIIGTRFEESRERAQRMAERGESALAPVRDASGRMVLSVIAEWRLEDVWNMLELFLEPSVAPFRSFSDDGQSLFRIFALYKDANEGVCGITLGDGGNKSPCGPRFGCAVCCVTGAQDKSMQSMLRDERYAFMKGLSDFRTLLINTQHDYTKRELIGRTLSPAGFLPVRPDVYSLRFRKQMLAHLLTLDVLEEERAEQLEADIITGRVADTPENRRMAEPQFQLVSLQQLVAVDFFWGLHSYTFDAFPAIEIWYEVRHLGRRFPVASVPYTAKTPVPAKRWYKAGAFDHEAPTDGLRDYGAEMWNPFRHPSRPIARRVVDGKPTVWFEEGESLEVDAQKAYELVEMVYPDRVVEFRQFGGLEGSRFLLNEEIVKLPAGMAARYQTMAERGQYFAHLAMKKGLTPVEMDLHLTMNSISDEEHEALLAEMGASEQPAQAALF